MEHAKKYLVLFGILLLLTMYISPLAISTMATEGIDDDMENLNERNLTVINGGSYISINSQLETGTMEDEFELDIFRDGTGLKLTMDYNSDSEDIEVELSFTVVFYSIIEYVDLNVDGIYTPGNDSFVKEEQITNFLPFTHSTLTTPENRTIHIINVTMTNGLFSLQLYAVENFEFINGSWISPAEMKFDIAIHNFNYLNGNSALALKTTLVSTTEYEIEHDTEDETEGYSSDEEEVETTVNGFTGFFSWTNMALVDGIEKQVKYSPPVTSGSDEICYINYPRGINIIHDPKIGIDGILRLPFNYLILVVVGIAAVIAVGLAIFFYRRKK